MGELPINVTENLIRHIDISIKQEFTHIRLMRCLSRIDTASRVYKKFKAALILNHTIIKMICTPKVKHFWRAYQKFQRWYFSLIIIVKYIFEFHKPVPTFLCLFLKISIRFFRYPFP